MKVPEERMTKNNVYYLKKRGGVTKHAREYLLGGIIKLRFFYHLLIFSPSNCAWHIMNTTLCQALA